MPVVQTAMLMAMPSSTAFRNCFPFTLFSSLANAIAYLKNYLHTQLSSV